nr:hypothetical protein [Cytophagales bacterium]
MTSTYAFNLNQNQIMQSGFMIKIEYFLICTTLFFAAMYFCLPVPYSEELALLYPWWAERITFGNIQLYEVFSLLWILLFGHKLVKRDFWIKHALIKGSVVALVLLAIWCGLVSVVTSPLPELDVGRTFRLLHNAALLCAVFYLSRKNHQLLLTCLVSGFLTGTIINLFISYQYPHVICGVLLMAGQNTPGVAMAIAIHMCAWLFSASQSPRAKTFSVFILPIFVFGAVFSASKLAWIIVCLGLIVWAYIFYKADVNRKSIARILKLVKLGLGLFLITFTIYIAFSSFKIMTALEENTETQLLIALEANTEIQSTTGCPDYTSSKSTNPLTKATSVENAPPTIQSLNSLLTSLHKANEHAIRILIRKIHGLNVSNSIRLAYFSGTFEIITKYPFGVGYSGFYEAMISTDIYKSGKAAQEVSMYEANPHSSFLWYATAGGIIGGLLTIISFYLLLKNIKFGLVSALGISGYVFFLTAALSFLAIGLIVPYIFNSIIFIVPTAIAAGWGDQSHKRST